MFKLLTIGLTATFLFISQQSRAKEPLIQDTLQEVIVTGSALRTDKKNIPQSVTIITRKQMEESGESSVMKLLNGRVPGLFVTEKGVAGFGVSEVAAGQISMRGMGGSPTTGVLVLIDGNPQIMGIFGHPLPDSYLTSEAERVEIIRGPASMLYGSNAMGGVINILTRKASKQGLNGEASLQYGSFNSLDLSLSGTYRFRSLDLIASLNRSSTDGERTHSAFDQNSGYLKGLYHLNKNIRLFADLNLTAFNAEDPGPDTLMARTGLDYEIKRGSWSAGMEHQSGLFNGNVLLFGTFGDHDISSGFHSTDFNNGIRIQESVRLFKQTALTFGLDGNYYGGKAEMNGALTPMVDTLYSEISAFVMGRQKLGNLSLQAGIRLNKHSKFGTEWTPSGGFAWSITRDLTWKASFGKGFRNPTLKELFMGSTQSRSIQPEEIWNFETGLTKNFDWWNSHLEATVYTLKGDNMIVVSNARLYNTGSVENKGVELSAGCEPMDFFHLNLTYSSVDMKTPVYGNPRNQLVLNGSYKWRMWSVSSNLKRVEHLRTSATSTTLSSFQNFTLLDIRLTWQALQKLEWTLSGNNLLNQSYETIRYYTMPGVTINTGIRYRF
jgi:outer membrane cobalamin receptor